VRDDGTRDLIHELAGDLTPVRPIASLRATTLAVLGAWLLVSAVGVAMMGLRPDLGERMLSAGGVSVIFASLAVAGVGGIVCALGLAVPGREGVARAGLGLGLLGIAVSAGFASLLVVGSPGLSRAGVHFGDLRCLAIACVIGAVPALGVVLFVGRAAPFRPVAAVLGAAAGTAALGAVAAEASCPLSDPLHMLLGHVLGPVAGVLILTWPLLAALRRLSR
jgi:hypothetical protein